MMKKRRSCLLTIASASNLAFGRFQSKLKLLLLVSFTGFFMLGLSVLANAGNSEQPAQFALTTIPFIGLVNVQSVENLIARILNKDYIY